MGKRKLFAICLTVALMASGCAETKSNGESSEIDNPDVTIEVSDIAESEEGSKVESKEESSVANLKLLEISEVSTVENEIVEESKMQVVISEPETIPDQLEESEQSDKYISVSSEVIEPNISDTVSYPEGSTKEILDVWEQINEEQISETHKEECEYSTIPNDQANIRYNPPPESSTTEKWASEMDGTEEAEDELQIWAITQCECITCDGDIIEEGTYVHILENVDIDDEYCVIQWYDAEANINEHGLAMFEIWESDVQEIVDKNKTAGIIRP